MAGILMLSPFSPSLVKFYHEKCVILSRINVSINVRTNRDDQRKHKHNNTN